jgi:hypothetical protein
VSALEERNRLHYTATEAAAAADEARLQHQERRMEAYADQLRQDQLAWQGTPRHHDNYRFIRHRVPVHAELFLLTEHLYT